MQPEPTRPTLYLVHGQLRITAWPATVRPPHGFVATAGVLLGPPRLRRAAREALTATGLDFHDEIAPPPLDDDERPLAPRPPPAAFLTWQVHGGRGQCAGLGDAARIDLVTAAAWHHRGRILLVGRDGGAVTMWQRALRERGLPPTPDDARPSPCAVVTAAHAAPTMHWRARRHDLLVVDRPEQLPEPALRAVLDGSAALQRLGFVDRAGLPQVMAWAFGLGPLLAIGDDTSARQHLELRLPLTADERLAHDAAFHEFLRAYDGFVAARPDASFAAFVQQARGDVSWRPALFAWHRAARLAAWNAAKQAAVAELLTRHRGARVLVFAPDRASSYAIAQANLIAALTAELPAAERRRTLAAFAAGSLLAVVGPRLLDLGVPAGSADVGIVVGGGFGRAQHEARLQRIAAGGLVYQLVTQDTVEVGRAHRFARTAARAPAAPDTDGR